VWGLLPVPPQCRHRRCRCCLVGLGHMAVNLCKGERRGRRLISSTAPLRHAAKRLRQLNTLKRRRCCSGRQQQQPGKEAPALQFSLSTPAAAAAAAATPHRRGCCGRRCESRVIGCLRGLPLLAHVKVARGGWELDPQSVELGGGDDLAA